MNILVHNILLCTYVSNFTTLWAQCLQCFPLSDPSCDFQLSESLLFRTLNRYLRLSYFTILCTSLLCLYSSSNGRKSEASSDQRRMFLCSCLHTKDCLRARAWGIRERKNKQTKYENKKLGFSQFECRSSSCSLNQN